jgi:hypothetical protein
VPLFLARPVLDFAGLVLLMYLFVFGTFFLALAGLDAGSAFGGMGSSREVAVAALAEPTIVVAILALAPARGEHEPRRDRRALRARAAARGQPWPPARRLPRSFSSCWPRRAVCPSTIRPRISS